MSRCAAFMSHNGLIMLPESSAMGTAGLTHAMFLAVCSRLEREEDAHQRAGGEAASNMYSTTGEGQI